MKTDVGDSLQTVALIDDLQTGLKWLFFVMCPSKQESERLCYQSNLTQKLQAGVLNNWIEAQLRKGG